MFSPINKMVNHNIIGGVGEPWDFVSSYGDNCFFGQIISVELRAESEQILLCDISPFEKQGVKIHRIVARLRNKSKLGICSDLLSGERVTCHFSFQSNGEPIEIGGVNRFFIENPNPYFMIGSLRLVTA